MNFKSGSCGCKQSPKLEQRFGRGKISLVLRLRHRHGNDKAQAAPKRYFGGHAICAFCQWTQQFKSSLWISTPETIKDKADLFLQFGRIVFEWIAMPAHAKRERRFSRR
jgi:hypothetical protein